MAEDLTDYLENAGVRVRDPHHDVKTIERMELIRDSPAVRRAGLVSPCCVRVWTPPTLADLISDAAEAGFLRSANLSAIQTIGRAARNAEGRVVTYEILSQLHGAAIRMRCREKSRWRL